jgi:hypothetical protein
MIFELGNPYLFTAELLPMNCMCEPSPSARPASSLPRAELILRGIKTLRFHSGQAVESSHQQSIADIQTGATPWKSLN